MSRKTPSDAGATQLNQDRGEVAQGSEILLQITKAIETISDGIAIFDDRDCLVFCNSSFKSWNPGLEHIIVSGVTFEEVLRANLDARLLLEVQDLDLSLDTELIVHQRMERHRNPRGVIVQRREDGRWLEIREQRTPDGYTILINIDITERKQLEEKLNQSQRMEAVGQLTGGVAHDFNNLLAVMIGNAEMLLLKDKSTGKSKQHIDEIIDAVDRASSLTSRLLAFSRQQALSPVSSDVTAYIADLEDMLCRTLGETIDFNFVHTPELWPAIIDPHQFENALVNLTLNARDSMPEGGKLTVETSNVILDETYAEQHEEVQQGDYVEVAVTDTGTGIPPDVLEKVFEPFFTTKDVGQGSGLGLSMVFGFAKQSNGHVSVYSEVGEGTTVKLYMPRSTEGVVKEDDSGETKITALGSERILVVEDDESVRNISVSILSEQGYDVVAVIDGNEAIEHLKGDAAFDLLFTDVILPGGMNGVEIAKQAEKLQPNIKVIYTTGYTENSIVHDGKLDRGITLVNKPYRRAELLEKVRNVLDSKSD